jgi:hypothetical protein
MKLKESSSLFSNYQDITQKKHPLTRRLIEYLLVITPQLSYKLNPYYLKSDESA